MSERDEATTANVEALIRPEHIQGGTTSPIGACKGEEGGVHGRGISRVIAP
jgi:hypothetical protein